MKSYIDYYDIVLIPLNLIIIFYICLRASRKYKQTDLYFLFWLGLFLRLFSGVLYYFYHINGAQLADTFNYYTGIKEYSDALLKHPIDWLFSLFQDSNNWPQSIKKICKFNLHYSPEESTTMRVGTIIGFLGFSSYTSIGFWFSLLSFWGSWRLFEVFHDRYKDYGIILTIPFLFIPSCFFWGSTITKDAITLGSFGLFFYSFYFIFFKKKIELTLIINLIVSGFLVSSIKGYILVLFMPALGILTYTSFIGNIRGKVLKLIVLPVSIIIFAGIFYLILNFLLQSAAFSQYLNEETAKQIKIQYEYLAKLTNARSSYDLGDFDATPQGIAKVIPKAINITLFRPYITEINSPPLALSGLESLLTLLLSIFVVLRVGLYKCLKILITDRYLIFCLVFVIFYSAIVGITSGNFGTLMRYKIPMMPFYYCILIIIFYKSRIVMNEEK